MAASVKGGFPLSSPLPTPTQSSPVCAPILSLTCSDLLHCDLGLQTCLWPSRHSVLIPQRAVLMSFSLCPSLNFLVVYKLNIYEDFCVHSIFFPPLYFLSVS